MEFLMSARLTYASLNQDIKQIAKEALGLGALRALFSYAHTYHLMIKISDGAFIGFSLYHFEETHLKGGQEYVTGVIDCICVAEPYRRDGFGTLLTFGTLKKMAAYGVDRVELMLKTPRLEDRDGEPGIPLAGRGGLLQNLGFKEVRVYPDYYLEPSKKYGFECSFCGNRPDTCSGVLYSINGT